MKTNIGGRMGYRWCVWWGWPWRFLPALHCTSAQEAQTVRLSSLDLSMMTTGWGEVGTNRSIDGNPLTIAGKRYKHGVGTHAPSRFAVAVNNATRFTAQAGVDDEVGSDQASVEFVIFVDGKERWRKWRDEAGRCRQSGRCGPDRRQRDGADGHRRRRRQQLRPRRLGRSPSSLWWDKLRNRLPIGGPSALRPLTRR